MREGSFLIFVFVFFLSCGNEIEEQRETLFTEMSPDSTGVKFSNTLGFDREFNIFTYRNFYNGGGVALGDINNDGLIDIYLTGNQVPNKLYLNKGNFVFEDITDKAGVAGSKAWSTGVSMADVNGDGHLDIYVCNSGDVKGDNKQNELFINNGDLTFTEKAEEFGVADQGFSTHAAFFDYDNDGDLDLYILNNSYQAIGSFNLRKNERTKRNALGGDKLMRNDGNKFIDVSEEAGIYGSTIGFGLGVTIGDVNKDGWMDIFISNDFFERDYLYINNQDGTFKECLPEQMKSLSGASMGADMADINNDGWADIFVTEMLPADQERMKTVTTFEDWNRYQYNIENDYYHQFTRNMLQLNNGNNTFSEVGRLAGVEATDWSWGALMFDMDNDGLKDIFVANGIYQDLTNQDFLQYASNEEFVKSVLDRNSVDYKRLTEIIPSNAIPNFAFHNQGNLAFQNKAHEWGLATPGFSNGSAYGDLDNDGDLDLVVNNVNMNCFVYRNNANAIYPDNNFIKIQLAGEKGNTQAFGSRIEIEAGGDTYYIEQMPIRGFESSVDPRPNIGLGRNKIIDRLLVKWPDGRETELKNVPVNQVLTLNQRDALRSTKERHPEISKEALLVSGTGDVGISFRHRENGFVDFDRDFLTFHMISNEGPRMATADVNGDGLTDVYIGGAKDQAGALYIQNGEKFSLKVVPDFERDRGSEDMGSTFLDVDGDGDLDLYVCSGSNEFSSSSSALLDRLYINDGQGNFQKSRDLLPLMFESSSTVQAADYDGDGDTDLFVGVRVKPFAYGIPMNGYILNNNGKGKFTDVTSTVAPGLLGIGMITDAAWLDIDGDDDSDLVIIGEFMPVKLFRNENGKFEDITELAGLDKTNGWWNRIKVADLDLDGDLDLIAGNHGLNSRFDASTDRPVSMIVNDFDRNGTIEQIFCSYENDKSYPIVLRHDLLAQLPFLKKKYLKYESYKDQTIQDIFTEDELKGSTELFAHNLATSIFINDGSGNFKTVKLPVEAQLSPVYGIQVIDITGDSVPDILLGGNHYRTKPQVGRYDASFGVVLINQGGNNFVATSPRQSGVLWDGEVRDILKVQSPDGPLILVSRNNDTVLNYLLRSKP